MARPLKQGLDYFSFDVDFFDNKKVRRIIRACGPNSGTILICLLCNIYRHKGYYILWNEDLPFDIADVVGVSEGAVSEVIKKSIQANFFDQELYDKYQILTSEEIQNRFLQGIKKRTEIEIDKRYWVISGINEVFESKLEEETGVLVPDNTQSKVKYSKVNKSKSYNNDLLGGAPPSTQPDKKGKEDPNSSFSPVLDLFLAKDLEECFEIYFSSPNYTRAIDILLANVSVEAKSIEELKGLAANFNNHCALVGKVRRTTDEWATHFKNWLTDPKRKAKQSSHVQQSTETALERRERQLRQRQSQ
jgi:hypothetical protein